MAKDVKDEPDQKFSMDDKQYADYCALKFKHYSIVEQQRLMRKLAHARNVRAAGQNSTSSDFVNRATWHSRVKLSREARIIHLFRAFLKGTPYKVVEQKLKDHTLTPMVLHFQYGSWSDEFVVDTDKFLVWLGVVDT